MNKNIADLKVLAIAGGVGGAKMAVGLQEVLDPGNLTVVVNTGDDFEHWGLNICPDIDTVLYNLAGINNAEQGWGRADESFTALDVMSQIGGEDWFLLGDKDLAIHLRRTEWTRQGISLTEITERLRRSLGIPSVVLPMSNSPVRTLVHTTEDDYPFQHYFVRRRCEPIVLDLSFVGADKSAPTPEILHALEMADVVVFCPSNPYLSIDPILSVKGLRTALKKTTAPVVAVSSIVGGQAVKGPAAKLMEELEKEVSPVTIAEHFLGLLDGFVLDNLDAEMVDEGRDDVFKMPVLVTDTMMVSLDVKRQLAESVLTFATSLPPKKSSEQPPKKDAKKKPKKSKRSVAEIG